VNLPAYVTVVTVMEECAKKFKANLTLCAYIMGMIDTHCHLELMKNVDDVVARCRATLRGVVSVATHPNDYEKCLALSKKHNGFVFMGAGVHPEYVKELDTKTVEKAFSWIRRHERDIVGVGEQGLDYFWIKETYWRERQKELFVKCIELAKELDKVLIVHTREAHEDAIKILTKNGAERVQLHMWGDSSFAAAIKDNGWLVSVGPVSKRSKKHQNVARDVPLEQLMLETDSPWFGGKETHGKLIGEPTNIRVGARVIAEIKGTTEQEVMETCAKNAEKLFKIRGANHA